MRRLLLSIPLILSGAGATADESIEKAFLEKKINEYEIAFEKCMTMGNEAELPDKEVITALRAYPQHEAETFLITHAAEMEDRCASAQLGELAIALQLIEVSEHESASAEMLLDGTKEMVFSHARWHLKRQYLQLPQAMKEDLTSYSAFQQPFNSLLIREHLLGH